MIRFVARFASLALAGAIISSPAYAAPLGEARSVTVRTADLDLSGPAGRAALTRRISYAAHVVCGRPDERDLVASRLAKTCHADALEGAMPQVQLALAGPKAGRQFAANAISVTARAF